MARKTYVHNRTAALWGGVACYVVGSFLLYDAWERRGKSRPWAAKLLPGG